MRRTNLISLPAFAEASPSHTVVPPLCTMAAQVNQLCSLACVYVCRGVRVCVRVKQLAKQPAVYAGNARFSSLNVTSH